MFKWADESISNRHLSPQRARRYAFALFRYFPDLRWIRGLQRRFDIVLVICRSQCGQCSANRVHRPHDHSTGAPVLRGTRHALSVFARRGFALAFLSALLLRLLGLGFGLWRVFRGCRVLGLWRLVRFLGLRFGLTCLGVLRLGILLIIDAWHLDFAIAHVL